MNWVEVDGAESVLYRVGMRRRMVHVSCWFWRTDLMGGRRMCR